MKRLVGFFLFIFCVLFYPVFANGVTRPKVSIIVPVYKVEPWLRECMDSLVNQTLKEIEIICVDDGSPDNCGKILDEYVEKDKRVKVIHQKNSGVQKARNAGLDVATGEYIAFVDPDDYLERNAYEISYNYAKKDNVDILNFKARIFKDGKDNHVNKLNLSDSKVLSCEDYIKKSYKAWVWDNLFKYDIIQKDKIRFVPGIRPADDTCFTYMALGRAERIKSIPAKFYNFRTRPGSLSRMTPHDVFVNSYKMCELICQSWRTGNCLKNKEQNLITLILRWANVRGEVRFDYAQEILDSFGKDIYNPQTLKKCPDYIQKSAKVLEKLASYSKSAPIKDGIYEIAPAVDERKRLDIAGGSRNNGANLHIWQKNSGDNQKFKVKRDKRGFYTLTCLASEKNIDVAGGGTKVGTNVQQYEPNGSCAQKWYIVPCGGGYCKIISQCNLMALDVCKAKSVNGTNIQCYRDNGTKAQKFKFIKVDEINEEPISIALSTDNNYGYPTVVCMTSILDNKNPGTKINFYVMLSGDFDQATKDDILFLQNKYKNCKIELIDMKDKFKSTYISRSLTIATYYRLLLSSLLPGVDKVLYIDTDTIVRTDLKKLFSYNMDNYYVAGVLDGLIPANGSPYSKQQRVAIKKGYRGYEELLGIPNMKQYISAGVCLFNLSKIRRDGIEEKFIKAIKTHDFEWHDQDTINSVCYNKILILPLKYNCMAHCIRNPKCKNLYSKSELAEAQKSLQIIHYTAGKPWSKPYSALFAEVWWKYAEKTHCFDKIQSKYLIPNGTYTISSALDDNKVLDIKKASSKDGAPLWLYRKNNTPAQKFTVRYVGNRCFEITPKCSNKALDVKKAGKVPGTPVQQFRKNRTNAQKWRIILLPKGYYKIVSCCNGLALGVGNGQTRDGTLIKCQKDNGSNAQKFKFNRELTDKAFSNKNLDKDFSCEVDCCFSIGQNCKSAHHIKRHGKRFQASPLDWMFNYSLNTCLHLFKTKFSDFFSEIEKIPYHPAQIPQCWAVKDKNNGIISVHHFAKDKPLDSEQHQKFRKMMLRRANKVDKILKESDSIALVYSQQHISVNMPSDTELIKFLKEFAKIYPGKKIYLFAVETSNIAEMQKKVVFDDGNLKLIKFTFWDYGRLEWQGNPKEWDKVMNCIKLVHKNKQPVSSPEESVFGV